MNVGGILAFVSELAPESQRVLADGERARIAWYADGKLIVESQRPVAGDISVQVFFGADLDLPEAIPLGSYHLTGRVESCARKEGKYSASVMVLTEDTELARRRGNRFLVFAMNLQGRVEATGEPFRARILDVSSEGLGLRPDRPLEPGARIHLSGWEPYMKNAPSEISFSVRSTFPSGLCGVEILPGQKEAAASLADLLLQLQSTRRFWESLVGHARIYGRGEHLTGVQVGVDFACRQLRNRKEVVRCLMEEERFENLASALATEMECQQLESEIKSRAERLEKLKAGQPERMREVRGFLEALEDSFGKDG